MSVSSLILDYEDFLVLRGEIIDKILSASSPDCALLYLYISRQKKDFSPSKAVKDLGFTKERYEKTIFELTCIQVIAQEKKEPQKPSLYYEEKPKYTSSALRSAREDPKFSAVCDTAENMLGKTLTEGMFRSLLYIYDRLELPADVIIELLVYLKTNKKNNIRSTDIENEARLWVDMGVVTYADVTKYIENKYAQKPLIEAMMQALKIYDRELSATEERYITAFINYGFTSDVVALCAEKTIASLNKFSFQYLNKILLNLKEQRLFTVEQILASDPKFKDFKQQQATVQNQSIQENALADWELEMMKELQKG